MLSVCIRRIHNDCSTTTTNQWLLQACIFLQYTLLQNKDRFYVKSVSLQTCIYTTVAVLFKARILSNEEYVVIVWIMQLSYIIKRKDLSIIAVTSYPGISGSSRSTLVESFQFSSTTYGRKIHTSMDTVAVLPCMFQKLIHTIPSFIYHWTFGWTVYAIGKHQTKMNIGNKHCSKGPMASGYCMTLGITVFRID